MTEEKNANSFKANDLSIKTKNFLRYLKLCAGPDTFLMQLFSVPLFNFA
jgi:hypothetical protein